MEMDWWFGTLCEQHGEDNVLPRAGLDVSLHSTLFDPNSPMHGEKLGACYVYRPFGHIQEHVTGAALAPVAGLGRSKLRAGACPDVHT